MGGPSKNFNNYHESEAKSDFDYNKDDSDTKRTGFSVRSDPVNNERSIVSQALNFNTPYNGN